MYVESIKEQYEECLKRNIVNEQIYSQNEEEGKDSKHFGSGAKVYLFFEFGGDGHERITVLGNSKKSNRL